MTIEAKEPVFRMRSGKSSIPLLMCTLFLTACEPSSHVGFLDEYSANTAPVSDNTQGDTTQDDTLTGLFEPATEFATGSWPEAVAIGDVNNDGLNDVVLTTSYYFDPENDYKLFVYLQDGLGGLSVPIKYDTRGSYTSPPGTVDIGDLNGDGLADVVIGNSGASIEVFAQDATGGLAASQLIDTPYSDKIRIGDFNGDSKPDVAGIDWGDTDAGIFIQGIDGQLSFSAAYYAPHGGYDDLEVGDVNSDGRDDVIVMSGQGFGDNLAVLTQNSAGTFEPVVYYDLGSDELTRGVGIGDVNGDGANDVVVSYGGTTSDGNIGIFTQNTSGTLDAATSMSSQDIPDTAEVADINGDGLQDIIALHGKIGIYLQQADGSMAAEELYDTPYATSYNPHGLAVGDINDDGAPDIVIADYNNGLVVLYNAR